MNEQTQIIIKETIEHSAAACTEILNEHRERQKTGGDIEQTLNAQRAAIEEIFRNEETNLARSRRPCKSN